MMQTRKISTKTHSEKDKIQKCYLLLKLVIVYPLFLKQPPYFTKPPFFRGEGGGGFKIETLLYEGGEFQL